MGTTTRLAVTPGRAIEARWKWLEGDEFASRVKNAFEQGVLRGASVGFVPKDSEQNRHGKKRSGPGASSEAMNPYAAVFGSAEGGRCDGRGRGRSARGGPAKRAFAGSAVDAVELFDQPDLLRYSTKS